MAQTSHAQLAGRRRRDILVLLVGAPAVVAALGVTALEAWRFHRPDSPLFVTRPALSLADAIARDDVERAYGFIRAGQDPDALIAVEHPTLTGGRSVQVSPLLWAVASGADRSLQMLRGVGGARADATTVRRARCLAEQLGHSSLHRQLGYKEGSQSAEPCPRPGWSDASPLDAFAGLE
jgi:hypothetical protein